MRIFIFFYLLLESAYTFSFQYPVAAILFPSGAPSTVYYGETLRIPVQMHHANLQGEKVWHFPAGSYLEPVSGACPVIPYDVWFYWGGICNLNIVIPGSAVGQVIAGSLLYHVFGKTSGGDRHDWNYPFYSPGFYVTVIPHPLSMLAIPLQDAVVKHYFTYPLKTAIRYYDENIQAGKTIKMQVIPEEQDGLSFDAASLSIKGVPSRRGAYYFKVAAQNANVSTDFSDLKIEVKTNPKDKPVFKKDYFIPTAVPKQKYSLNLMELLEPQTEFAITNQIQFRILSNENNPAWLSLDAEDTSHLQGEVPADLSTSEVDLTLIATSNTGGDSEPLTIHIPVTHNSENAPKLEYFELEYPAGNEFDVDLSQFIKNPNPESQLNILIDKIEPLAPWLHVSSSNPVALTGMIPSLDTGKKYLLTLRANTANGGTSESVIVPLQVSIDEEQTPRFKLTNPILPMMYPEQPFFYDFIVNNDVYPEYGDFPFEINFAKGYNIPEWLIIKNNQLIADRIPTDVNSEITIYITIKNTPGGQSKAIPLSLYTGQWSRH